MKSHQMVWSLTFSLPAPSERSGRWVAVLTLIPFWGTLCHLPTKWQPNGGFHKWGYPLIIHLNGVFPYKPTIFGYPIYGNPHMMRIWDSDTNIPLVIQLDGELESVCTRKSCFSLNSDIAWQCYGHKSPICRWFFFESESFDGLFNSLPSRGGCKRLDP